MLKTIAYLLCFGVGNYVSFRFPEELLWESLLLLCVAVVAGSFIVLGHKGEK